MVRVVVAVFLLAVVTAQSVVAQVQIQPDDRVELLFGAGMLYSFLYSYGEGIPRAAGTYQGGGALWLGRHLGIGLQHIRGVGHTFADRFSLAGYRHDGVVNYRFSILTARYRVFLDNGGEIAIGVGAQVAGEKEWRLTHRDETPIDETHREPWARGLAIELFVGRRLSRHFGVKGGVTFHMAGGNYVKGYQGYIKLQPVVFASVPF